MLLLCFFFGGGVGVGGVWGFIYKRGRGVVALNRNLLEEKMTFFCFQLLGCSFMV